jgi:hypothetical protein
VPSEGCSLRSRYVAFLQQLYTTDSILLYLFYFSKGCMRSTCIFLSFLCLQSNTYSLYQLSVSAMICVYMVKQRVSVNVPVYKT